MEAFWHSFILVAISEMGDKTQLLAVMLTLRFKQPWTVFAGIFVATLLNHAGATWFGSYVGELLPPSLLRYGLAAIFIIFSFWLLIPEKEGESQREDRFGAFVTTVIAFFLAEMGDKTQLATMALAARFQSMAWVTAGSTLGMLFTNGLTVFFGERILEIVPMKYVRWVASLLFFGFGLAILFG